MNEAQRIKARAASERWRRRNLQKKRINQNRYGSKNYWTYRENNWRAKKIPMNAPLFKDLLAAQAERCAICSQSIDRTAHVDHDHSTGRIRGLLCGLCNKGLGQFKDSTSILESAIKYLTRKEG